MEKFYDRVAKGTPGIRQVLDFLQTAAKHAGADVAPPTFDGDGVGITYRRGRKRIADSIQSMRSTMFGRRFPAPIERRLKMLG